MVTLIAHLLLQLLRIKSKTQKAFFDHSSTCKNIFDMSFEYIFCS